MNSITIDVGKGTIAVSGEVDPSTLVDAISKLGKRSELSSFQKNPTTNTTSNVSKKPQQPSTPSHGSKKSLPVKKNIQISTKTNKRSSQKGGINQDCGCHGDDSDLDSDDEDEDHDRDHMHAHHNTKGHHHGHAPHRPNGMNYGLPPPRHHSHPNSMYGNGYFPRGSLPEYQSMPRPYNIGLGNGSGRHHHFRPAMLGRPPPMQPVPGGAYGHGNYYQLPMRPPPPPLYGYHSHHHHREPPVGNSVLHLFSDDNTSTESCSIM